MTMIYAYTPSIWLPLFTVLLLFTLSVYSWRHRSVPGTIPFAIGSLFAAAWVGGTVMEVASVDPATQILWIKFQAAWQLPAMTAVLCFLLEYTWPGRWLSRRNLILLSIPPLLFLSLLLTNDFHHLLWRSFTLDGSAVPHLSPGGWLFITYSMLWSPVELGILIWLFLHSPQHRWPAVLIMIGMIGARILYILGTANIVRFVLPYEVVLVAYLFTMFAIALFGYHFLDPVPLAYRAAVEQLPAGVLVLDRQGRVANLNFAAEQVLGRPAGQVKGKRVTAVLPAFPGRHLVDHMATEVEFSQGTGPEVRYYTLTASVLKDFRGLEAGHLILLHDVTAQKRSQAQLVEHQQALAMLHERERLARELHDCLGQALAATHLQASTAKLLFSQGNLAQMGECLDVLAETTLQAEADMREYLLGTQTMTSADQPFFATLREFLGRFSRQYNLPVELTVPQELVEQGLSQTAAAQLQRIIQEALSNVRKHARVHNARVAFSLVDHLVQVEICDDGQGFDSAAIAAEQTGGFGLRSMRERAEALGGSLEIISRPGEGTQVIVQVPVGKER